MTSIEWTDATWNPTVGCTVLSPGCTNCYAMKVAGRLARIGTTAKAYEGTVKMSKAGPVWTGKVNLLRHKLDEPRSWRKPRMVFVNSMSDIFHEDVPAEFIGAVFKVMMETPQHTYQVLTKRPERLAELAYQLWHGENIWLGVSVEDQDHLWRYDVMSGGCQYPVRFISYEPALGPVKLYGHRPDWVIFGGESGSKRRPVELDWARSMRDECRKAGIPFFMKQVDKRIPIPPDLMVRQWPKVAAYGEADVLEVPAN
jgi:protein gp37